MSLAQVRLIRASLEFCQCYHELYANPLILISMAVLTRKLEGRQAGRKLCTQAASALPPPFPLALATR